MSEKGPTRICYWCRNTEFSDSELVHNPRCPVVMSEALTALTARVEALEKSSLEPEDIPKLQRMQGRVAELEAKVEAAQQTADINTDVIGKVLTRLEALERSAVKVTYESPADGQECPPPREGWPTREEFQGWATSEASLPEDVYMLMRAYDHLTECAANTTRPLSEVVEERTEE